MPQLLTIDFKLDSSNGKSQWDCRVFEKITFGSWVIFQNKGITSMPIPALPCFAKRVSYIFSFITIFCKPKPLPQGVFQWNSDLKRYKFVFLVNTCCKSLQVHLHCIAVYFCILQTSPAFSLSSSVCGYFSIFISHFIY